MRLRSAAVNGRVDLPVTIFMAGLLGSNIGGAFPAFHAGAKMPQPPARPVARRADQAKTGAITT